MIANRNSIVGKEVYHAPMHSSDFFLKPTFLETLIGLFNEFRC